MSKWMNRYFNYQGFGSLTIPTLLYQASISKLNLDEEINVLLKFTSLPNIYYLFEFAKLTRF